MSRALGFDFGTTNSVLALADGAGARPLSFAFDTEKLMALRTALAFWKETGRKRPMSDIGPWAVQRYLDHPEDSRFMQSLKTFAASPLFNGAYVYAQRYRFEDLLEEFFTRLRAHAGDMPNLFVPASGDLTVEVVNPAISLVEGKPNSVFDADGSAIVIHAGPDDYKTDPTGNAGDRVACGIIVKK